MKKAFLAFLLINGILLLTACLASSTASVPSDFLFSMDVKSAGDFESCAVNVNIRIETNGKGKYEPHDTDCAIEFDTNHMVTYQRSQVIEKGQFKLSDAELEGLWDAINQNNFFSLTEDYRMSIGYAYAFIVIEADGQHHIVDNIGMDVPELRTLVEATNAVMPKDIDLNYGAGFIP